MIVFCVFHTIQVNAQSAKGCHMEEYNVLQSIWLNQRDAHKEVEKHPKLKLHVEMWNAR